MHLDAGKSRQESGDRVSGLQRRFSMVDCSRGLHHRATTRDDIIQYIYYVCMHVNRERDTHTHTHNTITIPLTSRAGCVPSCRRTAFPPALL